MILTGVDQLWVADITYIRLEEEFVYLAVILDAYLAARDRMASGRRTGRFLDADCAAHGVEGAHRAVPAWCITPIVECSTPATTTPSC